MFDRSVYKKNARAQLRHRHTWPVLITLLSLLLSACMATPLLTSARTEIHTSYNALSGSLSLSLLAWVLSVSVNGILAVANASMYLQLLRADRTADFNLFLSGLTSWLRASAGALWFTLWTNLWGLLFIIPGIVKAISYSQMFFLLAEYKSLSPAKAMRISKILTQGHKTDLFVQGVSFLGWMLVGVCTCGIFWLWLLPYMQMTFANSYKALKNEALASGRIFPADFAQ